MCLCTIKTPDMWKPLYSVKQTGSPVPTVLELYKIHSIIRTLVYVCHIRWIQRQGIILSLSLIMLTFVWQRKGLKMWPRAHQLSTHYRAPEVYQKPLKYGYLHMVPTMSALQGLHCIQKLHNIKFLYSCIYTVTQLAKFQTRDLQWDPYFADTTGPSRL